MTANGTLLRELARVRAENDYLRRRVRRLIASRDHWRDEARQWKWGAIRNGKGST